MALERPELKRYVGRRLTVIAWLWARTVKSPNPAFASVEVPLTSTFVLSTKKGKEAYVEPVVDNGVYRFTVKTGTPPKSAKIGTTAGKRSAFLCLMSGVPLTYDHIRAEGKAGRMGARLMTIVAEGDRERVYLGPTLEHEAVASKVCSSWKPDTMLPNNPRDFKTPLYGINTFAELFSDRQLAALTTFSDLVGEARERILADAVTAGMPDDGVHLRDGGIGATAYADAVGVYLAFAVDKGANYWSTICSWHQSLSKMVSTFGRQAIPMVWDYAEANPFSDSSGNLMLGVEQARNMLQHLGMGKLGLSMQADATSQTFGFGKVVSTDPPYYDNIGYADLSDFFYVWLRRSLRPVFPDLFATLAVPKAEELVATPYRHGNKQKAEKFFLEGMTLSMRRLVEQTHLTFPATIYYAFKQSENRNDGGLSSTGWETFLEAVIKAEFGISGTWPVRTEYTGNLKGKLNALASSIVLVCRPRPANAPVATRREFVDALNAELPEALRQMQQGNIAPVDLAQAAIGPGMAVFTQYAKVLDASGEAVTVREAISLINQTLDEVLAEQEGDFDADTRWALAWFEQSGFTEGDYGTAETLSTAKNTSVAGMVEAGVLRSGEGNVRLLRPHELPDDWDPDSDTRLIAWEAVHHLVRVHDEEGEDAAASLMSKLGPYAEAARELAYRLYRICDQKNRSQGGPGLQCARAELARGCEAGPTNCPPHSGANGVSR